MGEPLPALSPEPPHATSPGFNESAVDPADRLPYLVIIVDELADLICVRAGREDPIVRLAQKARATGYPPRPGHAAASGERGHRPHQGQLPSRICLRHGVADRLAHDPRHAGAEDLIGPRDNALPAGRFASTDPPGRRFLSDKEIGNITEHWRPRRCRTTTWASSRPAKKPKGRRTADEDADRLAARCRRRHPGVRSCLGVASPATPEDWLAAAPPWTHRSAGGARHIGPFDGSNARQVLRRDGPGPAHSVHRARRGMRI